MTQDSDERGSALQPCARCGHVGPGTSPFCPQCGAKVAQTGGDRWYRRYWFKILSFLFLTPLWALIVLSDPGERRTTKVVAALVLIASFAAIGVLALDEDIKVYVECQGVLNGFSCTVDHRQGSDPAYVCWRLTSRCRNGVEAIAGSCVTVSPQSKLAKFIPIDEVRNAELCDVPTTLVVDLTTVKPN